MSACRIKTAAYTPISLYLSPPLSLSLSRGVVWCGVWGRVGVGLFSPLLAVKSFSSSSLPLAASPPRPSPVLLRHHSHCLNGTRTVLGVGPTAAHVRNAGPSVMGLGCTPPPPSSLSKPPSPPSVFPQSLLLRANFGSSVVTLTFSVAV